MIHIKVTGGGTKSWDRTEGESTRGMPFWKSNWIQRDSHHKPGHVMNSTEIIWDRHKGEQEDEVL